MKKLFFLLPIILLADIDPFKAGDLNSPSPYGLTPQEKVILLNKKNIQKLGLNNLVKNIPNLKLIDPVGYYDFMNLQMNAKFILTDSGGIQEESTFFGIPCLTLRPNTERPITITEGTNRLVKLDTEDIVLKAQNIMTGNYKKGKIPKYWDGKTAARIVNIFRKEF